ncbi:MAG: hypothetical protein ACLTBS_07380 [Eisenbergiella sp.]
MKDKRIFLFGIVSIIAILFLMLFSYSTSPCFPWTFGWDSAFFQLVGRGMAEGKLPYRDFFDMKGPWLFLIQYLGTLVGRYGVFLLQCIALVVELLLCIKCNIKFFGGGYRNSIILLIPFLVVMSVTMEGGNPTEEWCLPLLILCLYLALDFFCEKKEKHRYIYACIYGISFGFIAFIRITNATLICAIVLSVTVELLQRKEWRNLIGNAISFLGGILISALIPIIFFARYHELREMFYSTFIFGFIYGTEGFKYGTGAPFMLLFILPVVGLIVIKEKRISIWILVISNIAGMLLTLGMGNSTLHDYMLVIPQMMLGIWILNGEFKKKRWQKESWIILGMIGVMTMVYPCYKLPYVIRSLKEHSSAEVKAEAENIIELADIVRKEGGDSVWGYEVPLRGYIISGMMPYSRYCGWQEHYMELSEEIALDISDMLETYPPEWIVQRVDKKVKNKNVKKNIDQHYRTYAENEDYVLYRRRER